MGRKEISIDLLKQEFKPALIEMPRELTSSVNAFRGFFINVLEAESISVYELTIVEVIFFFYKGSWPSASAVRVKTNKNKIVECCVDSTGRRCEILETSWKS